MPILAELHKPPIGSRGAILGFLYGGQPLPVFVPPVDYATRPPPLPLLLSGIGKYRLSGPLYPATAPTYFRLYGTTLSSNGAPLGSVTVDLFRTSNNAFVDSVTSDSNGLYEFRSLAPATNYYLVAYKAGSPDVSGTTLNTLVAGTSNDVVLRSPVAPLTIGLVGKLVGSLIQTAA